ncbi:MAG: hypothetical protein ACLSB9_39200 [Hydrogeniiclostridium mannosilyticum]
METLRKLKQAYQSRRVAIVENGSRAHCGECMRAILINENIQICGQTVTINLP